MQPINLSTTIAGVPVMARVQKDMVQLEIDGRPVQRMRHKRTVEIFKALRDNVFHLDLMRDFGTNTRHIMFLSTAGFPSEPTSHQKGQFTQFINRLETAIAQQAVFTLNQSTTYGYGSYAY